MRLHVSLSLKIVHCCKHATTISKGSGAVTIQLHVHSNTANGGEQCEQNEQLQQQLLSRRQCLTHQMSVQRRECANARSLSASAAWHVSDASMQQQVAMRLSGICNGTDRSNTSKSSPGFIQPAATSRHADAVWEPFSVLGTVIVIDVASTAVSEKILVCC